MTEPLAERLWDQLGGGNAKMEEFEKSLARIEIDLHNGFIRQGAANSRNKLIFGTVHETALSRKYILLMDSLYTESGQISEVTLGLHRA